MGNVNGQHAYLHYYTNTTDYFIYGYDGQDNIFCKVSKNVFPAETVYQKTSLSKLLNIPFIKLDLSWRTPLNF